MNDVEGLVTETLRRTADGVHATAPPLGELAPRARSQQPSWWRRRGGVLGLVAAVVVGSGTVAAASQWDFWVRQAQVATDDGQMGAIEMADLYAPGGLFACTDVLRMTPSQVVGLGRDRGFASFRWQYEGRGGEWPQNQMPGPDTVIVDVVPLPDDVLQVIVADPGPRSGWTAGFADRAVCDEDGEPIATEGGRWWPAGRDAPTGAVLERALDERVWGPPGRQGWFDIDDPAHRRVVVNAVAESLFGAHFQGDAGGGWIFVFDEAHPRPDLTKRLRDELLSHPSFADDADRVEVRGSRPD